MKKLSILCALVLLSSGCALGPTAPFAPPFAAISAVSAPLDIDVENTKVSSKKGEASAVNVLGLVSFGDVSYKTAAENGGITVIHSSDYDNFSVLGIFSKTTVRVYGE